MEINGVYTNGDIEIVQGAEITAEETFQKEEFSDDESFIKIEIDTQDKESTVRLGPPFPKFRWSASAPVNSSVR